MSFGAQVFAHDGPLHHGEAPREGQNQAQGRQGQISNLIRPTWAPIVARWEQLLVGEIGNGIVSSHVFSTWFTNSVHMPGHKVSERGLLIYPERGLLIYFEGGLLIYPERGSLIYPERGLLIYSE